MSRHLRRAATGLLTSLLALGLLAVGLLAPPAHARPRTPDPERVTAGAFRVAGQPSAALTAAPATIDSDLYAYATSPTFRTYFVVAGHLKLTLVPGSTNRYRGSLVDYVGNKAYQATANTKDPDAPKLSFTSKNGTFLFRMTAAFGSASYSGTGLKVPSTLKRPAAQVSVSASSHTVRSASYRLTLTERSGPVSDPIEYVGTMTFVYDANGRISGGQVTVTDRRGRNVTHALRNSGYYSGTYLYTVAKVDKTYFGVQGTVSGTSFSGTAFGGSGATTSQWVVDGTA